MKRFFFTSFIIISCAFVIHSQVWCPPGATWHLSIKTLTSSISGYYDGDLTVSVAGTTLIAGKTCTTIAGTWSGTYGWPINQPMNWQQSIHTYFQNNVVYYYHQTTGNFDTLMDYKAKIGDSWYLSGWDSSCTHSGRFKMTVIDTGHALVNGISLKTYTISDIPTGYKWSLMERIGNLSDFFHPIYLCQLDQMDTRGRFMCYRDNQLGVYSKFGTCNFVGLDDQSVDAGSRVFPNPTTGSVHLSTRPGDVIDVYSQWGVRVLQHVAWDSETRLDLSQLADGLYMISSGNTAVRVVKLASQ